MYLQKTSRALALSGALSAALVLAACGGESTPAPSSSTNATSSPAQTSQKSEPAPKAATPAMASNYKGEGQAIYDDYCAACHQANGEGIEDIYPAFPKNEFINGSSEELIFLMLEGRAGMPAFYEDLTPEEIKNVINHLRNSWGNQAGDVTQKQVNAAIEEIGEDDSAFSREGD